MTLNTLSQRRYYGQCWTETTRYIDNVANAERGQGDIAELWLDIFMDLFIYPTCNLTPWYMYTIEIRDFSACTNLSISSIILADHLILSGTFITTRQDIDRTLNSPNDIFRDELCEVLTMSVSYAASSVSIWDKPTMLQRKHTVLPH